MSNSKYVIIIICVVLEFTNFYAVLRKQRKFYANVFDTFELIMLGKTEHVTPFSGRKPGL